MSPIEGPRWKCIQCPVDYQVDLCDECIGKSFVNATGHDQSHKFMKLETADTTFSSDYGAFEFCDLLPDVEHNYLNPSFVP